MAVTLLMPTALRGYTDGKSELSLEGGTAGGVLAALAETYPDVKRHLFEDDGSLRSYVNLYLGESNIKNLDGLGTAVNDGDTLTLVPAIAGGSTRWRAK
ncbi:MAG: MoaD/ThiS family protein [Clostridiales Family XIII bacterium]|jgi:molybdopterin converting factor small subunit|nr:MoaD/ThiS family protein [Clostridiales Family XIII bacterium]